MQENDRQEQFAAIERPAATVGRNDPAETHPIGAGREDGVTIDFDAIAHGSKLVRIRFRGQVYQLRTTRNGKLILNK